MKSKSIVLIIMMAMILVFSLSGCACRHEWKAATCESPSVCAKCGATAGEPLGHVWEDATCIEPKTCSVCGKTMGEPLGHTWVDATCVKAKTCSVCGREEGQALGHAWKDATCTEPKTCSVCGTTEGSALGHQVTEWKTTVASTCSQAGAQTGICNTCGIEVTEELSKLAHTLGDWEVETAATLDHSGKKVQKCKVCGETINISTYNLSAEEVAQLYKKSCVSISYKDLARNPDAHKGKLVKFKGEVIQVLEASSALYYTTYRIDVTKQRYYWTDTVYVVFDGYGSNQRILEDDIVTFYGEYKGLYTYQTIFGASVTIPHVHAEYIDLN